MPTIIKTSYRDYGAANILAYIARDDHAVKDRAGRELSVGEQADFVAQSEDREFEREMIISPEEGEELTERELELRTRQTMREFCEDRPSARYVYAVHDDSDHVHSHVVLTGEREDLYMDRGDIRRVRERANDRFRNAERAEQRVAERDERGRQREQNQAAAELDLAAEREQEGPEPGPER